MKQIKILGVLAIALTLGLAACGGGKSGDQPAEHVHTFDESKWESNASEHWHPATCEHTKEKGDKAKHTWGDPYDVVAATCTEAGSQKVKCTVCEYEKKETIKATGHSAQPAEDSAEWTIVTEPSCTEVGSKTYVCANCKQAIPVEIPALGHVYEKDADGNDVVVWASRATCTEAGSGEKECTRCHEKATVTEQALGHVYEQEDGADKVVWSREATCELGGLGEKECTRCHAKEAVTTEALGHDLELIGGETVAPEGEAAVRLYECKRCHIQYLGFKADEPSPASLPHLMVGDNGGMRFFGRPIGNAMALTADGTSVKQQNNECVYCSTETGDFFEYIFTLNAAQAATLETCRLYCDARPANYLSGDFWAYNRSADDWTPGYYIDGADEHVQHNEDGTVMMVKDHAQAVKEEDGSWTEGVELETEVKMGARIEDYRYILYVDDKPVDFDKDTSVPVKGSSQNMQRAEYVLPYTFHLHEGQNKISLRMAGGYRSEFYNFVFRPYVEPTPITVNETALEVREGKTAQITSSMEGLLYKSSDTRIATVDANGLVTGVKAGTATISVSKEGNYKDAKVAVTVLEKEGIVSLNLADGVKEPAEAIADYSSGSSGFWFRNPTKDGTLTYTFQSELAGNFDIQMGLRGSSISVADNMSIKVNGVDVALEGTVNTSYSAVEYVVGVTDLKAGENTMVITFLADSALYMKSIKFIPHVHAWGEKQEVAATEGTVAYDKYECTVCHQVKIEVKLADSMLAEGSQNKNDPAGYMKLKSNNQSFSFTINVDKAMTGKIFQRGVMDSWSNNKNRKVFSGGSGGADDFELKIGDTKVDVSAYKSQTWADVMKGEAQEGNLSALTDVESGVISLAAGNNTISYKRLASYNLALTHIVFIVK